MTSPKNSFEEPYLSYAERYVYKEKLEEDKDIEILEMVENYNHLQKTVEAQIRNIRKTEYVLRKMTNQIRRMIYIEYPKMRM